MFEIVYYMQPSGSEGKGEAVQVVIKPGSLVHCNGTLQSISLTDAHQYREP